MKLPHPIPYQGSKRALAPSIGTFLPSTIKTFYEPFAGSAAMTIYVAHHGIAKRFIISDSLPDIIDLWDQIINDPKEMAKRYREVWLGQKEGNTNYFNEVRERYNNQKDPIDLLYLICRCVKNAIRFNAKGNFTQSVDKRRLGMSPDKMELAAYAVSGLLKGRVDLRKGDWLDTTIDAKEADFVYMDPPYFGTSQGRDKRYFQQLSIDRLIEGLNSLNSRNLRYALSYDGTTGDKTYAPPLPNELNLNQIHLHAGRSSQSTLSGLKEDTIESLYLSANISTKEMSNQNVNKDGQLFLV